MRAIFTESLLNENLKLESSEILEITFFLFISSDSCHKQTVYGMNQIKQMLLESVNSHLDGKDLKPW